MKKVLSLILALTMIFSSLMCFTASAEDASEGGVDDIAGAIVPGFRIPEDSGKDINQMLKDGEIEGEMLGIDIDFLYGNSGQLFWTNVAVSKNDIALAKANLNSYLKRLLTAKYGGFNLYTMENNAASIYATRIANFIGNMFFPDFTEVEIQFEGTKTIKEDAFYEEIVVKSGFGQLLQANWCDQLGLDIRPLIEVWGLDTDTVLDSEYRDGLRLGKKLVSAVVNKVLRDGPISMFLDIVNTYSKSYLLNLYDATVGLFNLKINAGVIDPEELKTMEGLMNLIFNNNDPDATDKLQFATMPVDRFRMAQDTTELFLYMLLYSNINCRYMSNYMVIDQIKNNTDDKHIKATIDVLLRGDVTELVNSLSELMEENLGQVSNDLFTSIKNSLAKLIQKILDYFDRLFSLFF